LDHVAKDCRVNEQTAALERVSLDTNTFWVDARRHSAIVRCQIMRVSLTNVLDEGLRIGRKRASDELEGKDSHKQGKT
jgi:hypothetical protein